MAGGEFQKDVRSRCVSKGAVALCHCFLLDFEKRKAESWSKLKRAAGSLTADFLTRVFDYSVPLDASGCWKTESSVFTP